MRKAAAVAALVGIGVLGRLVPHLPNATPINAVSLAASRSLGRFWAVAIPLAAVFVSDVIIGFYNWAVLVSVYASFAVIGLLNAYLPRSTSASALRGPLLFFIVTNFAVWMSSTWYDKSLEGLLVCYSLGLPFLASMLVGDVVYGVLLTAVGNVRSFAVTTVRNQSFCKHVGSQRQ